MYKKRVPIQRQHRNQVLILREEPQIPRDVNVFHRNKRCLRSYPLQYRFRLITKRTFRFRIELKLNRFSFQQNRLKAELKHIF